MYKTHPSAGAGDQSPQEALDDTATSLAYQYGAAVPMGPDTASLDVALTVVTQGTVTSMSVKAQQSMDGVTWADVDSDDDLAAGATAPAPYVATYAVAGSAHLEMLRFQRRGLYMRFGALFDVADGTFRIDYVRQVAS